MSRIQKLKSFNESVDMQKNIEEIFYDLSDDGDCHISKNSKYNDDRYTVKIKLKNIFKKIDFYEITSRLEDLGYESFSTQGVKNGSLEYFEIEFWKPLSGSALI